VSLLAAFGWNGLSLWFTRYLLAVLSVFFALQVDWLAEPYLSMTPPFLTFLAAIMLTAWHGGFPPALVATILSVFIVDYYLIAPLSSFKASPADFWSLGVFALEGMVMAYCIDHLQRARQKALHAKRQLSRLHELNVRLFDEPDSTHLLRRVLTAAMELLKADKGMIQLYDQQSHRLVMMAQVGFSEEFVRWFHQMPAGGSFCEAAFERKQRVIIDDIAKSPAFASLADMFTHNQVVAVQSTPLFNMERKVIGVLSTCFRTSNVPSEETLGFLDLYAHQAERILETKRTEEALRGVNVDLERRVVTEQEELSEKEEKLQSLLSELAVTEERERKHLALELHDYLAQLLALATMKLALAQHSLHRSTGDSKRYLEETEDAIKKSLEYARTLMAELTPPELHQSGLPLALRWLAGQMPKHGLDVDVSLACESLTLPEAQAVLIYRSVRELLINVVKHAAVDRATISLRVDANDILIVAVQDSGRGFNASALTPDVGEHHFGLRSIRERMAVLGGSLDFDSLSGRGTRVTLRLPLPSSPAALSLRAASAPRLDRVSTAPTASPDQESLPFS
jgi:signal transduction histidine kinase